MGNSLEKASPTPETTPVRNHTLPKPAMTTNTCDNASAVHRVINTTELLEEILLGLDTKTLLLSQRVNRQFKAVIDGSTQLQQALFFKQAPTNGHVYGNKGQNDSIMGRDKIGNFFSYGWYNDVIVSFEYGMNETSDPEAQEPKPSWLRMYLRHGSTGVGLTLTIRDGPAIKYQERIGMPDFPMTMAQYHRIARTRYGERLRLVQDKNVSLKHKRGYWDPEEKIVKKIKRTHG